MDSMKWMGETVLRTDLGMEMQNKRRTSTCGEYIEFQPSDTRMSGS